MTIPADQGEEAPPLPQYSTGQRAGFLASSVGDRMFFVPGMVVTEWFDLIPERIPFQHGCGYRFLAPFAGCAHYNIPIEAYKTLYPDMVEKGVVGTVNVASFMEDYANWGRAGLFFSGIVLAVILWAVRRLFDGDRVAEVALNVIPILSLSSAALSTTLLSGGWMAMLLLYFMFRTELQSAEIA